MVVGGIGAASDPRAAGVAKLAKALDVVDERGGEAVGCELLLVHARAARGARVVLVEPRHDAAAAIDVPARERTNMGWRCQRDTGDEACVVSTVACAANICAMRGGLQARAQYGIGKQVANSISYPQDALTGLEKSDRQMEHDRLASTGCAKSAHGAHGAHGLVSVP